MRYDRVRVLRLSSNITWRCLLDFLPGPQIERTLGSLDVPFRDSWRAFVYALADVLQKGVDFKALCVGLSSFPSGTSTEKLSD